MGESVVLSEITNSIKIGCNKQHQELVKMSDGVIIDRYGYGYEKDRLNDITIKPKKTVTVVKTKRAAFTSTVPTNFAFVSLRM